MTNKSVLTYIPPKTKFIQVSNSIVDNYDPEVVGVYCKIVKLSSGKSLTIEFIAKKTNISERKIRRIIVFLESEGYVVRKVRRGEKGSICGWNYCVYAEPVPDDERSHAGVKRSEKGSSVLYENRQVGQPSSRSAVKSVNGQDYINNINLINKDNNIDNIKKSTDVDKKARAVQGELFSELSEDEKKFLSYMKERHPRIMRMDKPLTLEQAREVKKKYGYDLVMKVMDDMENWKPLLSKRVSAYMTIIAWCIKERDRI